MGEFENNALVVKIGKEQIATALEVLKKYKAGKANLEKRIISNEQFWKLRHWNEMGDNGNENDPKPTSGWLVNTILNRHADAMDNFPEPTILPRAEDDQKEAETLTKILPVILQQNGFKTVYSDAWWYKLKQGCAVYGVFWDSGKLNGLGDITVRSCDLLNLFWQPGIKNIQDSRNLFHCELVDNDLLEAKYPQLKGKLSGQDGTVSHYIYDDTVDTSEKTLVVDWYYHTYDGARKILQYCKFAGGEVLFATENEPEKYAERGWYDHGKYPFRFDTLFPEEGTPCGFGFIDIAKDPQKYIDLLNQAILKNTLAAATPRFFIRNDGSVNEQEFADYTKPFVHVDAGLGSDSILPITSSALPAASLAVLNSKIDEMRETTGNTESATGVSSSSVTAASAIAALQEASGKLSRDMINNNREAFADVVLLCIDLIRQFYDAPRTFRITGDMGKMQFVSYDNSGLQPVPLTAGGVDNGYRTPVMDVEVYSQNESRYDKAEYNQLAMTLYQAGMFRPDNVDQSLLTLSMMNFKGKEKLEQELSNYGTVYKKLAYCMQTMLKMAQTIDALSGTQMAEDMASKVNEFVGGTGSIGYVNAAGAKAGNPEQAGAENTVTAKARAQAQGATRPR